MMKMKFVVMMLVAVMASVASAETELLINGDFESGYVQGNTPDDWAAYYDTSAAASTNVNWNGAKGQGHWVELTGWSTGWVSANQAVAATAGYEYTLSLDTKVIDGAAGGYGGLSLRFFDGPDGTGNSFGWTLDTSWTATNTWTNYAAGTFVAPAGTASIEIALWAWGDATAVDTMAYDNVSLIETVPEPMTLSLLGLGGLMLRRRKK